MKQYLTLTKQRGVILISLIHDAYIEPQDQRNTVLTIHSSNSIDM